MNRTINAIVLALLAVGLLVFILMRGLDDSTAEATPPRAATRSSAADAADASGSSPGSPSRRLPTNGETRGPEADLAPAPLLPASLRGTDVDGSFETDAAGRFLPTHRALRVFDYFLSAIGEVSMDVVRELVRAHALSALPEEEVEGAMALFELYLAYQERSEGLGAAPEGGLTAHFARVKDLQSELFGFEDAEALFGRQNALADVTLARRELMVDENLDEAARAEALLALEEELPEEIRAAREAMAAPARARSEVEILREAGGSDAQIFALRESYFGAEAAGRLADLDATRATWEGRVATYRRAREGLVERVEGENLARELDRLREAHFDETEALRVAALDRIELGR